MIVVTRLNDSQFAVNPDLIERIHSNPDTTLVMVDGAKYIVTETMDQIISMIAGYRAQIVRQARDLPTCCGADDGHALELVRTSAEPDTDTRTLPVPLRPVNH